MEQQAGTKGRKEMVQGQLVSPIPVLFRAAKRLQKNTFNASHVYVAPSSHPICVGLKACLGCRLVKTMEQYRWWGCNNCRTGRVREPAFGHRRLPAMAQKQIAETTTGEFSGMAAILNPGRSWVAKYLGV
eukprot:gene10647-3242_t